LGLSAEFLTTISGRLSTAHSPALRAQRRLAVG